MSFNKGLTTDSLTAPDGAIYTTLALSDCRKSIEEGMPQLPLKTVSLIIPSECDFDKIEVNKKVSSLFSISYPLFPVQKPIPTKDGFDVSEFISPNRSIYKSDQFFPNEQVRFVRTSSIRGNKIVTIEVSPVIYNPVKGMIEFSSEVEFKMSLKPSSKQKKFTKVRNQRRYNEYLKSLVDNDADVDLINVVEEEKDTITETELKSTQLIAGIPVSCEYVIITSSSLAPYFTDFINWKKKKGIDIELVTTEAISQNYTGDLISGIYDEAGKIRQFLSEAYENGLEYVLLGGDNTVVSIRYGTGYENVWTDEVENDYKIPTDLYFSDFDGDWNVDLDQYLGERYGDEVDYGSEVFVGRLLCSNGSQIQAWTNKLLQYEQNPGDGNTSYLKRAFYSHADQMQSYDQARDIAARFGSMFTTNTVFEEIYNGNSNSYSPVSPDFPLGEEVVTEMNSGYGFISWFNHGNPQNIAVGTKWYNECGSNDKKKVTNFDSNTTTFCLFPEWWNGLDNLDNSNQPFVLYTISCETMPFDTYLNTDPGSNLGAQITNQSGNGGPLYLGNTRYGWVTDSWYLQQDFTDLIAGGTTQPGVAEAFSKVVSNYHFANLTHNLLGCPETDMWTDSPLAFTDAAVYDCGTIVTVKTGSISGCKICIMSSNDNGASYYSVVDGVSEYTFNNVPASYSVVITKHNYLPKIFEISDVIDLSNPVISGPSTLPVNTWGTYSIDNVNAQYATSFYWSSDLLSLYTPSYSSTNGRSSSVGQGTIYCRVTSPCGRRFANKPVTVTNNLLKTLVFSPNPTSDETIMSIETDSKEAIDENFEWDYEIYSPQQKIVEKKSKQKGKNCSINVSSWAKGVYVVNVTYGKEVLSGKLTVK